MNKQQAENILNGYVRVFGDPKMDDVANALREIIIDAMTGYKASYASTYPLGITVSPTDTGHPAKPSTTYTTIHNGGVGE